MPRLIECVPNFSEGRDLDVIRQITDAIEAVDGVTLLDVDPGAATNRTVVTFVGEPEPVLEAAVQAGHKAAELIDMSQHHGEHPRFGCMDVSCHFRTAVRSSLPSSRGPSDRRHRLLIGTSRVHQAVERPSTPVSSPGGYRFEWRPRTSCWTSASSPECFRNWTSVGQRITQFAS